MGVLAAVACMGVAAGGSVLAQSATSRYPITEGQRTTADQVAQAGVPLSALAPNAPDSYVVKRGDTLWDLSKMYLTSPWRWPELWGMNKDQIANPHLIYPGQELRLVKEGGRARLEIAGGAGGGGEVRDGKLQPAIRDMGSDRAAIRSIPTNLIQPFLSQPLVLEPNALNMAPRVVATQEGRVWVGRGDSAYVRGLTNDSVKNYSVFRPLRPLYDPDDVNRLRPIAYEAVYVGTVNVTRPGEIAKIQVQESKQEIGVGDRLMPIEAQTLQSYVPKLPATPIDGRVISIYDGVRYAGGWQIVTLNRGANEGLTVGDTLQLYRAGHTIEDKTVGGRQFIKLPDEQIGLAFVFRVFPTISYALIQRGTEPVQVGDRASTPTDDLELPQLRSTETEADRVLRQPLRPLVQQQQ
jgi:LysM repeat protein